MSGRKKFVLSVMVTTLLIGTAGCGLPSVGETTNITDAVHEIISRAEEEVESGSAGADAGTASDAETEAEADAGSEAVSDEKLSVAVEAEAEAVPEEAETEPAEAGTGSAVSRYAYQTLTEEEQTVYDEIVAAFTDMAEEAGISTTSPAVMEQAYMAVRYDHCEFFWVGELAYVTYTRNDKITAIDIRPGYTMSAEEQAELQRRVDAEADRMLADAPVDGSDFEKALYVYETLIREVDYDVNAENGQTILSVFLEHATVCQGYSYATQYLLERLGIPCTTVTGTADGEPHAWNLVFLDGDYYYIDTTWGNSQYINRNDLEAEEVIPYKYVDYDYFGITTAMLSPTHIADTNIPLPVCEATADNYYVHKGLYIDTWDPDRIGEIFRQGYQNGENIVRVRFSDSELYNQAIQYFLNDGNLFNWCDGLRSLQYLESPGSNVMVVVFP